MIHYLAIGLLTIVMFGIALGALFGPLVPSAHAHSYNPGASSTALLQAAPVPSPQLASLYSAISEHSISDYLVSEKYDGIRAIWTGSALVTRQGNAIHAPEWFTAVLPNTWLDGELWAQRQDFESLSSIVRSHTPDERWQHVRFMVFDMPDKQLPFSQRYKNYQTLVHKLRSDASAAHIQAVQQHRFESVESLQDYFQLNVEQGAEGVMLHLATATHQSGRSHALLKLKPHFDAEAEVIAHLPGRGKYTGMMGALRLRNDEGVEFSVGTGFTDEQRAHPPAIGSIVTFKYHGYTRRGIPRFASFLRLHD